MNNFTKPTLLFFILIGFSLQSFGQYCMPSADCTYGDGIREFGIGAFLNASGCEEDNAVAGYGDFTALTGIELGQGTPYTVSLLSGYGSQQMSIWIDADNSMSFDSSELILADMLVATEVVNAEVTIPNIALGNYRLRVMSTWNGPSSGDACVQGTYGETEDYTITIVAPPSCPGISGITISMLTDVSAMVGWSQNGSETVWDIEVVDAGTSPTGMPTAGYDNIGNPMMLTGLTPEAAYDVYVRADCGMDNTTDASIWTGPISFTTDCAAFVPAYNTGFDVLTDGDIPACWFEATTGDVASGPSDFGEGSWVEDGFGNDGTTGAMKINLYQEGVVSDWLISPRFDLSTGGPYQVEFDFSITDFGNMDATNLGSDDKVSFLITTDGGTTWTSLQGWNSSSNINPLGQKIILDLTSYAGMTAQFAFYATDGTVDDDPDNDIFVDNFFVRVPPTCIEVDAVAVGNITDTSAEVSWNENGSATAWDIEIVDAEATPTGMPTAGYDNVGNPIMLTGLTPEAAYDIYVRADCGMDNTSDASNWTGPVSFVMDCSPIVPDYYTGFDMLTSSGIPSCWFEATDGDLSTGPTGFGASSWFEDGFANDGFSGAMKINLYQGDVASDWLISPTFSIPATGTYQVEFDFAITEFGNMNATNLGSDDKVSFLITTDGGTTWASLAAWSAQSNVNPLGEKIISDLSAYAGMNVSFAFYATDGTVDDPEDNDIFVDNFYIRQPPSCIEVDAVSVGNLTNSSAELSWNENGSSTSWDVEVVDAGATPTGMPTAGYDNVTNPVTLSALASNTSYDVYVRSDCGMDNTDISAWQGPLTFTTECDVFSVPYSNDFSSVLDDSCWREAGDGDLSTGPSNFGASGWAADGYGNNGFDGAIKVNLYTTGNSEWLISPTFNIDGTYQVEFDAFIVQWNDTIPGVLGSDDVVALLISTDGMATWTSLFQMDSTSMTGTDGQHFAIDLSPYAGTQARLAFYGTDGTVDDAEDNDISFDNFDINAVTAAVSATAATTGVSCNGLTDGAIDITVSGGVSPFTFLWSNGETTEDISGLAAGDYMVTITDAGGATSELSETVTEPVAIESSTAATDESIDGAADGSIDLTASGGTAPFTFAWDNGATTEDLTDLEDGTYCVTITDANGCTNSVCADVMAGPVSINTIKDLTSFRVYPNPVADQKVWIDMEFSAAKDLEIRLTNAYGQDISRNNFLNITSLKTDLEVNRLPSGMYFIKVTSLNDDQLITYKILKQ